MAQVSRPQAGDQVATPAYVDAGPYTGDQWADRLRVVYTVDETTMGPLLGIDNELAVTYAGLNVTVAKGAGFCDGHLLFNTSNAVIAVNGPAGGTRTDYVCMVENNSAAQINVGALTNYDTAGNLPIPPYSCRLAVVKNCPANFVQTNALYMVRLARIKTQAAAITSLTDFRTFCQFATDLQDDVVTPAKILDRTREFFVQAVGGWDDTGATALAPHLNGWDMPDNNASWVIGSFSVPSDYASGMTLTAVVRSMASGTKNVYARNSAYWGPCAGAFAGSSTSSGYQAIAMIQNYNTCMLQLTIAGVSAGDIVSLMFDRNAGSIQDTVNASVWIPGWLVEYTADS